MTTHKNKFIAINKQTNNTYIETSRDRQPLSERTNTFNISQSPSGINRESVSTSSLHHEMLKTFGNNENEMGHQYIKKDKGSSFVKNQSIMDTVGSLLSTITVIIPRPGEKNYQEFQETNNNLADNNQNYDWKASLGPLLEKIEDKQYYKKNFSSKESMDGRGEENFSKIILFIKTQFYIKYLNLSKTHLIC